MSFSTAIPTTIDGHSFPSRLEARRYAELKLLVKAGRVRNLEMQKTYRMEVNGQLICKYLADFVFEEFDGRWRYIVEDTKGRVTREFQLKAKLFKALYGAEIRIVVAAGGESTKPYKRQIPSRPLPKGRKLPTGRKILSS